MPSIHSSSWAVVPLLALALTAGCSSGEPGAEPAEDEQDGHAACLASEFENDVGAAAARLTAFSDTTVMTESDQKASVLYLHLLNEVAAFDTFEFPDAFWQLNALMMGKAYQGSVVLACDPPNESARESASLPSAEIALKQQAIEPVDCSIGCAPRTAELLRSALDECGFSPQKELTRWMNVVQTLPFEAQAELALADIPDQGLESSVSGWEWNHIESFGLAFLGGTMLLAEDDGSMVAAAASYLGATLAGECGEKFQNVGLEHAACRSAYYDMCESVDGPSAPPPRGPCPKSWTELDYLLGGDDGTARSGFTDILATQVDDYHCDVTYTVNSSHAGWGESGSRITVQASYTLVEGRVWHPVVDGAVVGHYDTGELAMEYTRVPTSVKGVSNGSHVVGQFTEYCMTGWNEDCFLPEYGGVFRTGVYEIHPRPPSGLLYSYQVGTWTGWGLLGWGGCQEFTLGDLMGVACD